MPEDGPAPLESAKAAALTTLLAAQHPLCVACISSKAELAVGDIEPTVSRIEQAIAVKRDMGHCKACERWTLVYSLRGYAMPRRAAVSEQNPSPMPANAAAIAVLVHERPMCLDCIASKSDITISEADRYLDVMSHSPLQLTFSEKGRCRACGEGRLVFSLQSPRN